MNSRSRGCVGLFFVLMGVLLALAGCGPTGGGDASDNAQVALSASDNGSQVTVDVGQVLVLTLESNPSTGYRWDVMDGTDAVLEQKGQAEFKVDSELDPPPPGTGGVEIFRFEAVESGKSRLELIYHRPWVDEAPLETFSIQVVVR